MIKSKVGIVILNYIKYDLTIKCLINLNEMDNNSFFVIVVDNSSPNDSYKAIETFILKNKLKYKVYLSKTDKNGGYSYGNNVGVKEAEKLGAEYILIMNNDIYIDDKRFLDRLVEYLDKNKEVAVVGPGIIQRGDVVELPLYQLRIEPLDYILNNILYPLNIIGNKIARLKYKSQDFHRIKEVYSVSGSCFIIRAQAFKDIRYFDENVFLYGEELILGEKLYKKGYKVHFVPEIRVYHMHSSTVDSIYDYRKIGDMQLRSHNYYLNEYRKDLNKISRFMMFYSEYIKYKIYIPIIILTRKSFKTILSFVQKKGKNGRNS